MQRGTAIPEDGHEGYVSLRDNGADGDFSIVQHNSDGTTDAVLMTQKQVAALRYWLNEWHDEDVRMANRFGRRL